MNYFELMESACRDVSLELNENKYKHFMHYKNLIQEWNEKINLTAITEDEEIIKKHFIDSIKVFNFKEFHNAKNVIDIGTGAGFPGIPIKIIKPDINIVLLDSLLKRVNFLNNVIDELNLKDIKAVHGRAEELARTGYRDHFDIAVSRAVANLTLLSELCLPFIKKNGYFVAMKGPNVDSELNDAKKAISSLGGKLVNVIEVTIEDSDLKHNLVVIRKIMDTPKQFPRKPGAASKKPIK
ncbi:MAG: 16S rRNA (guanine(527)-N(7))-methyltransferase RsmG [Solirubrobacterales bacterium]